MYSKIKSHLSNSYALSWLLHSARLKLAARRSGPRILIYQMGKVGSTAVLESLQERGVKGAIYHVHFLASAELADAKRRLERLCPSGHNANNWCLLESEHVNQELKRENGLKWKIITLVRDPVSRTVSSFFYNIQRYQPDFYEKLGAGLVDTRTLVDMYLHEFPEHDYTLDWFDKELKAVFDVDVYNTPFPKDEGYTILTNEQADVLVLKLEMLTRAGPPAFKKFLALPDFVPTSANTADERDYKEAYKRFVSEAVLPRTYLDKMYGSRLAKQFYSDAELERFRAKWRCE